MPINLASKAILAVATLASVCEAATLTANGTATATPTTTNGVTNEQIAGALAAALAGSGGSFGAYGDVILGMGDIAGAPKAAPMGFNGARASQWRPSPRPCKSMTFVLCPG